MPKNVRGGTLCNFLNIYFLAKCQKIDGGLFGAIKKLGKNDKFEVSQCRKKGSLIVSKKVERGSHLLWTGFLSRVRGFGCVENEVLSTYGKSA